MAPSGNKKRKLEEDAVVEDPSSPSSSSEEEQAQENESESERESDEKESEGDNNSDSEAEQEEAVKDEKDSSESEEESMPAERETASSSDRSESEEEQEPVESELQSLSSSDSEEKEGEEDQEEDQEEEVKQEASESEGEQEEVKPTEEPKKKKQKKEEQQPDEDDEKEQELRDEDVRMHAVRRMLEPFSWEQLVEMMANAAAQHDEFYADLKTAAGSGLEHRKVFVNGLALKTKLKKLKKAFKAFGEIEHAAVITDRESRKSRGFGNVTFTNVEAAVRALAQKSIVIDGCKVSCRLDPARPGVQMPGPIFPMQIHPQQQAQDEKQQAKHAKFEKETVDRRLFVFGLSPDTTEETLRQEFKKFGALEHLRVVRDRMTKLSKGYAFVTYREKAGAVAALETPTNEIDGHATTCQLASQGKKQKHKGPRGPMAPKPMMPMGMLPFPGPFGPPHTFGGRPLPFQGRPKKRGKGPQKPHK